MAKEDERGESKNKQRPVIEHDVLNETWLDVTSYSVSLVMTHTICCLPFLLQITVTPS
jgi:hypothetical protein